MDKTIFFSAKRKSGFEAQPNLRGFIFFVAKVKLLQST